MALTPTSVHPWVVFSSSSGHTFQKVWRALQPETQSSFAGLFIDRQCPALNLAREFLPATQIHDFTSPTKEAFEARYREWVSTQSSAPLIILIGYFRLISADFLKDSAAVVNTHPSLLPAFPGLDKKVHEAAFEHTLVSGFSVHLVNEAMDAGPIIFQKSVDCADCRSSEELRERVRAVEQKHLPTVIDQLVLTSLQGGDRQLTTRELQNKVGFPSKCVD